MWCSIWWWRCWWNHFIQHKYLGKIPHSIFNSRHSFRSCTLREFQLKTHLSLVLSMWLFNNDLQQYKSNIIKYQLFGKWSTLVFLACFDKTVTIHYLHALPVCRYPSMLTIANKSWTLNISNKRRLGTKLQVSATVCRFVSSLWSCPTMKADCPIFQTYKHIRYIKINVKNYKMFSCFS